MISPKLLESSPRQVFEKQKPYLRRNYTVQSSVAGLVVVSVETFKTPASTGIYYLTAIKNVGDALVYLRSMLQNEIVNQSRIRSGHCHWRLVKVKIDL